MSKKQPLKGMRDVPGMRTVIGRSRPGGEQAIYIDLHRLVTEKARLERELAMWQANVQRIQERLAEIDAQMQQLDEMAAREREKRNNTGEEEYGLDEMTLTY